MLLIHASDNKFDTVKNSEQLEEWHAYGIWYAPTDMWIRWAKERMGKTYKYFYKIELFYTMSVEDKDPTKVLRIDHWFQFAHFTKKYKSDNTSMILVDWKRVAQDFGGIELIGFFENICSPDSNLPMIVSDMIRLGFEIAKNNKDQTKGNAWIGLLDVPCGVVWEKSAVKSFSPISEEEIQYYIKYQKYKDKYKNKKSKLNQDNIKNKSDK